MICSLLIAPNGFCAAIREQQTPIVTVESVSQSRLDAHAGRTTSEDQRRDRSATQDVIEVGFEEPAVAVLGYDKIAGLRGEFVDDLGVPRIAHQDPAARTIGRLNLLSDTHGEVS